MVRVDVWDKQEKVSPAELELGLPKNISDRYKFGEEAGSGGFGRVFLVTDVSSGD